MSGHHKSSSSTSSNEGSAYPWILEHILAYPGTYEIPLRTMYTLNSTSQLQQHPRQSLRPNTPSLSSSASSPDSSPQSPDFPLDQQPVPLAINATDNFKSSLMTHISQLPSQPFSLPPSFIMSFVRRCFTDDLCQVDFTQSLTAMDYLKDLENRRKRELALALQRLGLDKTPDGVSCGVMSTSPNMSEWVKGQQDKARKAEAFYTQVYIGLRRWTLINEMRLEPFNKANCIAMLNTLYPPTTATPPTYQLTAAILASQRNAFFRYITAVEKNGKAILSNLENQGQRPGDMNGWAVVRETVDKYLRTANNIIEDCMDVTGPEYFDLEAEAQRRKERRADSGIGFSAGDRPSTGDSVDSKTSTGAVSAAANKPLPKSPPRAETSPCSTTSPKKKSTRLERIARELRNLRNRNDVRELSDSDHDLSGGERDDRGLRKMRSTGSINKDNGKALHSRSGSEESRRDFDFDAKRRRMILEAQKEKENRRPETLSRPVVA